MVLLLCQLLFCTQENYKFGKVCCNARRVQNGLIIGGIRKQIMSVTDGHANNAFGHYGVFNLIIPNTSDAHTNHYKWACVRLLCTP